MTFPFPNEHICKDTDEVAVISRSIHNTCIDKTARLIRHLTGTRYNSTFMYIYVPPINHCHLLYRHSLGHDFTRSAKCHLEKQTN